MWELDYKKSWAPKNLCFWTVAFESSLNCKEIQPVHPKGNQSWIFIGRTDAEAESPIVWPPDAKNWLLRKDPDAGKDWKQEEKGMTEEMAGWHHQLNGYEFEQALGVGDGQGGLVCCIPWDLKESDTTVWLNWTELNMMLNYLPALKKKWEIFEQVKEFGMNVSLFVPTWQQLVAKSSWVLTIPPWTGACAL